MNVLDIDKATLDGACYRASQSLMWNARQETDPIDMMHASGAAACAELYTEALEDMVRSKVLAGFELSLKEDDRAALRATPSSDGLGPDLPDRLRDYLSKLALCQSYEDMEEVFTSVKQGHPTPDFKARVAVAAEVVSGGDVTRRAVELLAEQEAAVRGTDVSLKGEAEAMRGAADALGGRTGHEDSDRGSR